MSQKHLKPKSYRLKALTAIALTTALSFTGLPAFANTTDVSNEADTVTITGNYRLIAASPEPGGDLTTDQHLHFIETEQNELVQLHVADESELEELLPGTELTVIGTETDGITGEGLEVNELAAATDPDISDAPATGQLKTAVILIKKGAAGVEPLTPAEVNGLYFSNPDSSKNFFEESSWNALSLGGLNGNSTGDVFGYLTIPDNASCYTEIPAGEKAARDAGINLSLYDLVSFVIDSSGSHGCGYGGYAYVGGRESLNLYYSTNTPYIKGTINHEIGHSLGLRHAKSLLCQSGSEATSLPAPGTTCTTSAYGDPFDNMGGGTKFHYSAYYKYLLGWIPESNLKKVSNSGDYTLAPHTKLGTTPQLLQVKLGDPIADYVIEYRQPYGTEWETTANHLSHSTGAPALGGLQLRRIAADGSELVRTSPKAIGPARFPLRVEHGAFTDPATGTSIQLVNAGANAAVRINIVSGGYNSNFDQVYLRGTHNNWGTSTQMELIDNNKWQIKANFGGANNERFKFDINGDWSHNYGDNNNDKIADSNGADIPITQGAGEYTITWNDQTRNYTVVKTPVPNQNPVPVITPGSGLTLPAGIPVTFDGSASYDPDGTIVKYEWSFFGERGYSPKWTTVFDSPGNFTVNFIVEDNDGARVSKEITVHVTHPTTFTKQNPQVYLRGTHNAWATDTQMRLVGNNSWWIKVNFTGNTNERFKFDINGDWSHNYGDNNGDKIADYNAADIPITQGPGSYIITWNELSRAYTITKE